MKKINLCKRVGKKRYFMIGDARTHRLYPKPIRIPKSLARKICKKIKIVKLK